MREEQLLPREYPTISVVIPALNEAQNLQYVLPYIPPIVNEVILVDGHSSDDTVAVKQRLLPTIRIIKQDGKGKGNALKAGFATPQIQSPQAGATVSVSGKINTRVTYSVEIICCWQHM